MNQCWFAVVVAPRTGKIIKNGLNVFERRENLLKNGMLQFVFMSIVRNLTLKS